MNETKRQDLYAEVTQRILTAMDEGTAPWQRPWKELAHQGVPRNGLTNREYSGINTALLQVEACQRGYDDNRWFTFNQANMAGAKVRRGEKSTAVYFFKLLQLPENDQHNGAISDTQEGRRAIPFLAQFRVFNAAQLDGVAPASDQSPAEPEPAMALQSLLAIHNPLIRHGGSKAYYSPSRDIIQLPSRHAFPDQDAYIATACHELGHWTGAPHRLNRKFGNFGSPDYAREELRAEWASAMLAARIGVPYQVPQHASYLAAWRDVLKADRFEVIRAARDAQRIADYLIDAPLSREDQESEACLYSQSIVLQPHNAVVDRLLRRRTATTKQREAPENESGRRSTLVLN
jgi:antirestriction protein ArdC